MISAVIVVSFIWTWTYLLGPILSWKTATGPYSNLNSFSKNLFLFLMLMVRGLSAPTLNIARANLSYSNHFCINSSSLQLETSFISLLCIHVNVYKCLDYSGVNKWCLLWQVLQLLFQHPQISPNMSITCVILTITSVKHKTITALIIAQNSFVTNNNWFGRCLAR